MHGGGGRGRNRRLRHHPCLALWSGNNEDYSLANSFGLYDRSYSGDLAASPFPARALYEQHVPVDVVTPSADLSPYRLVVHCGNCTGNRREMLSRIHRCREAGVGVDPDLEALGRVGGDLRVGGAPASSLSQQNRRDEPQDNGEAWGETVAQTGASPRRSTR